MTSIGTPQDGDDISTIRQIALISKMAGAGYTVCRQEKENAAQRALCAAFFYRIWRSSMYLRLSAAGGKY